MGCTSSAPGRMTSDEVSAALRAEAMAEQQVVKLLLLGAGESGKSTVFKQLRSLHGGGYEQRDLAAHRSIVHANTIASMSSLLGALRQWDLPLEEANAAAAVAFESAAAHAHVVDEEVGGLIKKLWGDASVQTAFSRRAEFQLNDSAEFFFDKLDTLMAPDYVPSFEDVLRSRVRTSGIVESEFDIEGTHFKMFDVGGQRNERKKWIHCFDSVTAVMYVVGISEYDQVLFEDDSTNRVDESLKLFEEVVHSRWFMDTSIILFLNKTDLFDEKIRSVPLSKSPSLAKFEDSDKTCSCSSGHRCTCGVQETARAIVNQAFLDAGPAGHIYSHFTCATDTENIKVVFTACRDIILRKALGHSGFM